MQWLKLAMAMSKLLWSSRGPARIHVAETVIKNLEMLNYILSMKGFSNISFKDSRELENLFREAAGNAAIMGDIDNFEALLKSWAEREIPKCNG